MAKLFISYSHKDFEFVKHLDSQLKTLVDVFWDWNLRVGNWRNQLAIEIETCDYFVIVMSPEYEQSSMCQWELNQAFARNLQDKHMIPIYLHMGYKDNRLTDLQYGDFTGDFDFSRNFDEGFRKLTFFVLGERISPWEHLSEAVYNDLLAYLEKGVFPCPIAKEIGEWAIVHRLWNSFEEEALREDRFFQDSHTYTLVGILEKYRTLVRHFAQLNDARNVERLRKIRAVVSTYVDNDKIKSENVQLQAGQNSTWAIKEIRRYLALDAAAALLASKTWWYQNHYEVEVADKLRELITNQARKYK